MSDLDPFDEGAELLASMVDQVTANHVLNFFRSEEGMRAGEFMTLLFQTTCHADQTNKYRLGAVFPAEVAAIRLAQDHRSGIARLRIIAKGE